MASAQSDGPRQEIVFFDTETTIPQRKEQRHELLEFAAVVVAAQGLHVLHTYSTLIRPKSPLSITHLSISCNGITPHRVADAPEFAAVAHHVHRILNGKVWAGHNIVAFDIVRIKEAFSEIGQQMPSCTGVIDTLPLLRKTFGYRAGNLKMESLAKYCGLGQQEHRSLADVQLNLDVLKHCSTVLFLETHFPTIFPPPQAEIISPLTLKSSKEHIILQEEFQTEAGEKMLMSTAGTEGLQESMVPLHKAEVAGSLIPRSSEEDVVSQEEVRRAKSGGKSFVMNVNTKGFQEPMVPMPQALIASSMILRNSEEHVTFQEKVQEAKSSDKNFVRSVRAKGLKESRVLFRHDILEKEESSLSGIADSKHVHVSNKQADNHFCMTALSSTLEQEALEEGNMSNEFEGFSSVYAATENAPWRESILEDDSKSKQPRKSNCNISHENLAHTVECLPSVSEKPSTSCSFNVGSPESRMGTVQVNSMFQVEKHNLMSSGGSKDHNFLSSYASGDNKNLSGLVPLCKAAQETCYDTAESSNTFRAGFSVKNATSSHVSSTTELRQRKLSSESFFSASWISLDSIELKEESGPGKRSKLVFHHRGTPLRLREINAKVRYSVSNSFAFDSNGKPRFSIVVEPSSAACNVISKCEDLVKIFTAKDGEDTEWKSSLKTYGPVTGARLSIGTVGVGPSATYTTEFYRQYATGVEKLVMDTVDADTVRHLIPRGSVVGVAFELQVYSFNGLSGIRLLADHLLL